MTAEQHICQVAFSALDASSLRRWYQQAFELVESGKTLFFPPGSTRVQGIESAWETCGWLIDRQDYFQLEFFNFLKPKSRIRRPDWRPSDIGYGMVGIAVTDFDATVARVRSLGSRILAPAMGEPGQRRVCASDPEGNIVEIFEEDPFVFGPPGIVRPEVTATVRMMRVSVPDLEQARQSFVDALGLRPEEEYRLHEDRHEALWGLEGAKCKRLVVRSDNFLVELVEYVEPEPRPWPDGYRICDQGFMNIALGYRRTADFDRAISKAVAAGMRPNGKPVDIGVFKVMYVNDPAGFSVELLNARKSFWSVSGFNPRYPYVENEVWVNAPPESVWPVLTNHAGMGAWSAFDGALIQAGENSPNGLGAVRQLTGLGMNVLEEVTEWRPNEYYSYRLLRGAPIKNHRGDVTLIPENGGTRVRWAIRFRPVIPGGGQAVALLLDRVFRSALGRLKTSVEKDLSRESEAA